MKEALTSKRRGRPKGVPNKFPRKDAGAPPPALSADAEYLTRAQIAAFLTSKGFITAARSIATWHSLGEGPPIAGRWGNKTLYRREPALAWAMERAAKQLEANP